MPLFPFFFRNLASIQLFYSLVCSLSKRPSGYLGGTLCTTVFLLFLSCGSGQRHHSRSPLEGRCFFAAEAGFVVGRAKRVSWGGNCRDIIPGALLRVAVSSQLKLDSLLEEQSG